jgi:hypothetical protein
MSHFLERLTYLTRRRKPFANGLGELARLGSHEGAKRRGVKLGGNRGYVITAKQGGIML